MSKGKAKEEVVAAASKYRGVMIPPRTGAPPPQDAAWLEAYDKAIRTPSPQKLDSLGTILDGLQDGRYNSAPAPNSLPEDLTESPLEQLLTRPNVALSDAEMGYTEGGGPRPSSHDGSRRCSYAGAPASGGSQRPSLVPMDLGSWRKKIGTGGKIHGERCGGRAASARARQAIMGAAGPSSSLDLLSPPATTGAAATVDPRLIPPLLFSPSDDDPALNPDVRPTSPPPTDKVVKQALHETSLRRPSFSGSSSEASELLKVIEELTSSLTQQRDMLRELSSMESDQGVASLLMKNASSLDDERRLLIAAHNMPANASAAAAALAPSASVSPPLAPASAPPGVVATEASLARRHCSALFEACQRLDHSADQLHKSEGSATSSLPAEVRALILRRRDAVKRERDFLSRRMAVLAQAREQSSTHTPAAAHGNTHTPSQHTAAAPPPHSNTHPHTINYPLSLSVLCAADGGALLCGL